MQSGNAMCARVVALFVWVTVASARFMQGDFGAQLRKSTPVDMPLPLAEFAESLSPKFAALNCKLWTAAFGKETLESNCDAAVIVKAKLCETELCQSAFSNDPTFMSDRCAATCQKGVAVELTTAEIEQLAAAIGLNHGKTVKLPKAEIEELAAALDLKHGKIKEDKTGVDNGPSGHHKVKVDVTRSRWTNTVTDKTEDKANKKDDKKEDTKDDKADMKNEQKDEKTADKQEDVADKNDQKQEDKKQADDKKDTKEKVRSAAANQHLAAVVAVIALLGYF